MCSSCCVSFADACSLFVQDVSDQEAGLRSCIRELSDMQQHVSDRSAKDGCYAESSDVDCRIDQVACDVMELTDLSASKITELDRRVQDKIDSEVRKEELEMFIADTVRQAIQASAESLCGPIAKQEALIQELSTRLDALARASHPALFSSQSTWIDKLADHVNSHVFGTLGSICWQSG